MVVVIVIVVIVVIIVMVVVIVIIMAAAFIVRIVVGFGGKTAELRLKCIGIFHGGTQGFAVQLVPGGGDDHGVRVDFSQHGNHGGKLLRAHVRGAGEHDARGAFYLVAPKFSEIPLMHLCAPGVHHGGGAAGDKFRVFHAQDGAYHIRELSDAGRLDQYPVGMELRRNFFKGLGKVPHQAAADAAGAHLGDFDPGFL